MFKIKRVAEILFVATRLGTISFGGPVAHIGYFRDEYVNRRGWLDEETYLDVVSLCQVLPGPTSSQVGIVIGMYRSGFLGGLAAWIGFTLPSAFLLILFAFGISNSVSLHESGWLHGLKLMSVAVVSFAVWSMASTICTDRIRMTITVFSAIIILSISIQGMQFYAIVAGALLGWLFLEGTPANAGYQDSNRFGKKTAIFSLIIFVSLIILLPVARHMTANPFIAVADSFYRTGALVFGGGHVVLPLLQSEVVDTGWVTQDAFLAGYGAAQGIPGPLFTFAGYLGATMAHFRYPLVSGLVCLVAIFLPSFLLILGILPFWAKLRSVTWFRGPLGGVNAAVVGLLLAALYDPIWTNTIKSPSDFAISIGILCMLAIWRHPIWVVVLTSAIIGQMVSMLV